MPDGDGGAIVCLVPAGTEIVCALGLEARLAGVSHECDIRADLGRNPPVLTRPRISAELESAEIDRQVRALLERGEALYEIDAERLAEIQPHLIVTQDQCAVCALPRAELEAACLAAGVTGVRVLALRASGLYDLPRDFRRVAEAAGEPERGDALAHAFLRSLAGLSARVSSAGRPRVALLEWLSPPMVAGGWMPELARVAGGEPALVTRETHFRTVAWGELLEADPDVVAVLPCGFSVERTERELALSSAAASLRELRATREGRTYLMDGGAHFNRPGPGLAESAALLAGVLHPELFPERVPPVVFM